MGWMTKGVLFGDKHSYRDFGLILAETIIESPKPKTNYVKIPLSDGSMDLSEALNGDVKYDMRTISFVFGATERSRNWTRRISELENYLQGQKMRIVLDDDIQFFYRGRPEINKLKMSGSTCSLQIDCNVEPYKYDMLSSAESWIWDTFDFETGYINEAIDINVNGTKTVKILAKRKLIYPIITSSAVMTVKHMGKTYDLKEGTQKMYDMLLPEGENVLVFYGTGTVSVDYRGGSL